MRCERCGAELEVGSFPFCRRGPQDHARGSQTVIGDEIDVVITNGTPTPIRFRSLADLKAWKKAKGYEDAVRHVGLAGTDKSPHTVNWCSRMDPQTAENVRILLERAFKAGPAFPQVEKPLPVAVTTGEVGDANWSAFHERR